MAKTTKNDAKNIAISEEKEKLLEIFTHIEPDKKSLAEKLIDRAAFMIVTLENYEARINKDGEIVKMQQGAYTIDRDHPAARAYNTMIKNFHLVIKQLIDMLPEKPSNAELVELKSFIGRKNGAGSA